MTADDVKRFIKGLRDLSTLPVLLDKIITLTNDENSDIDELDDAISFDQALAQRVLRVANSAFFGHSGQIRDIHQAVLFLGVNRVKATALGMSVLDVFPARASLNVQNLWVHSYEVAFLSSVISGGISITQPQECFVSGLLHDVGRIIFYTLDRDRFAGIETTDTMLEQETAAFGCTHAEAGGWFGEEIGLPGEIVSTIRYHHKPSLVREGREVASIVSLAEGLSRQFSPHLEDDGIWTPEHDAILLEFSLHDTDLRLFAERFRESKPEIEKIFAPSES